MSDEYSTVAFKEWAVVVDQLGSGRQALILRKGGIAEGRSGFTFKKQAFFLFPTGFHQQKEGTVLGEEVTWAAPSEDLVQLQYYAIVQQLWEIRKWDKVAALRPFHCWSDEVLRERFAYDQENLLSAAFVRVYSLEKPWILPNEKKYGGCRSWVTLAGSPPTVSKRPVMDESTFQAMQTAVKAVLD